jgi:hypothetical protein
MSAQARRERAYRHYVQKQMKQRQKAIARAQKAANRQAKRQLKEKLKLAQPSEPRVTTNVEDVSPEMPSVFETAAPPPSPTDSVAPPVTVSASNEIMATQNPDQPSPP